MQVGFKAGINVRVSCYEENTRDRKLCVKDNMGAREEENNLAAARVQMCVRTIGALLIGGKARIDS